MNKTQKENTAFLINKQNLCIEINNKDKIISNLQQALLNSKAEKYKAVGKVERYKVESTRLKTKLNSRDEYIESLKEQLERSKMNNIPLRIVDKHDIRQK